MIPSPISALVSFLKADAPLAGVVGTRVFGGELPESENAQMPRSTVLLRAAGGGVLTRGSYIELQDPRIDVISYGSTPYAADLVSRHVQLALKQMRRNVQGPCLLHWANPESSPQQLRDPDTEWPFVLTVWQVLVSEREVV